MTVDMSSSGAIFTGLAIATSGSNTYLYAANFSAGTIDVFDSNYKPVTLPNAFVDSKLPAGYAPFNIQALGSSLYVAYAQQNTGKDFSVAGAGLGYVDVYDTSGTICWWEISATAPSTPITPPPGLGWLH